MDGFSNSKIEKQTIYEIYRACRLCGAGAGYKMPIIQNVVDLDGLEVELKHKIRDCVQIEVHQDDKMPPLICELCVDKVNDFYEFLEMCRQTNKRTRLRLGLPPQTLPRGAPDAGDCILGVTEPVFVAHDDSNEPLLKSKAKQKGKDGKHKQQPTSHHRKDSSHRIIRTKIEPRTLRSKAPSPPRLRGSKRVSDEEQSLNKLQQKSKRSTQPMPKSILKRERDSSIEENNTHVTKMRRLRSKDSDINEIKTKRVKIVLNPLPTKYVKSTLKSFNTKSDSNTSHKSHQNRHKCNVCKETFPSSVSLCNHMKSHNRNQQPQSTPRKEPFSIKCKICGKQFPNKNLHGIHECSRKKTTIKKQTNRPSRQTTTSKNIVKPVVKPKRLSSPRRVSTSKKRGEFTVDPELLKQMRPFQVRIARCDPLIKSIVGDHYYVSEVDYDFGLDKRCVYPYFSFKNLRIKSEPGYMVKIQDEIKKVLDSDENCVLHWDSEDETDSDLEIGDTKKVDSLTSISLKTLFSPKLIGKVPKKQRKVKVDNAFDSILNASDFSSGLRRGIDDIINSLDDEQENEINKTLDKGIKDSDSLFGDDKAQTVTNNDFDSLFNSQEINGNNDSVDKTASVKKLCNNEANISRENISDYNGDNVNNDNNTEKKNVLEKDLKAGDLVSKDINKDCNLKFDNKELKVDNLLFSKSDKLNNVNCIRETGNGAKENDNNVKDKDKLAIEENFQKETMNANKDKSHGSDDFKKDNDADLHRAYTSNGKYQEDSIRENEVNTSTKNNRNHVHRENEVVFNMDDLEDVSDSEIEDTQLMKEIDAQIAESGTVPTKIDNCNEQKIEGPASTSVKSTDLESISDDEFNI